MRTLVGVMLVAAFVATPLMTASADHGCNGNVTNIGDAFYIDDRGDLAIWIYQETNGEAGLQSGGAGPLDGAGGLLSQQDSCDHENPDTIIF